MKFPLKVKPAIFVAALMVIAAPFFAFAQSSNQPPEAKYCDNKGALFTIHKSDGSTDSLISGMPVFCNALQLIGWIIQMALIFAGMIATVFIIVGGYNYLTAGGNDEQAEKGRKILTNSVIGLVVILLSGMIVRVVVNTIAGNTLSGGNTPGTGTTQGTGGDQQGGNNTGTGGKTGYEVNLSNAVGELPSGGEAGSRVSVTFYMNAKGEEAMTAAQTAIQTQCGGSSRTATLDLYIGNERIDSKTLSTNTDGIAATAAGTVPNTPGQSTLSVRICGSEINSTSFQITPAASSSGTDTGSGSNSSSSGSSADQAAARSSFAVTKKDSTTLRINVSASPSDRQIMCNAVGGSYTKLGDASQYPMTASINGSSYTGNASALDNFVDIVLDQPLTSTVNISVSICGKQLGGGAQSYTPSPR